MRPTKKQIDPGQERIAKWKAKAKARREHLGCLLDHWPGDSDLERYGNALEKMLIIGMAYGHGGQRECGLAAGVLGIPTSHAKVILDVLEDRGI